ncbi:MAG: hypothetical protein M3082_10900 [Candidatus Dormibacteraeota bacterium]|nr:hypothetical protein [Candidatus Dormibacteraeota bacterium]
MSTLVRDKQESAMRFIPTSTAQLEQLKKQAKKLQRSGIGKLFEKLDQVARAAGYDHWHHVTVCHSQSERSAVASALIAECEAIAAAAEEGIVKIVMTGPEATASQPLVLFSTASRDAWLLDPEEDLALCLVWAGTKQPAAIDGQARGIQVAWDGTFELAGDFFKVDVRHPEIGARAIGGYPLDELRRLIDRAQSADRRVADTIFQVDAVELTPEIVEQLERAGWARATLDRAVAEGMRYSPSRNSLFTAPVEGN